MLLNGQTSDWSGKTDVPQGFILAALTSFSCIYINDLSDNLLSTTNLLKLWHIVFSVVNDINISANDLNKDLQKISEWAYKWKTSFNPDLNKPAQEVAFSF